MSFRLSFVHPFRLFRPLFAPFVSLIRPLSRLSLSLSLSLNRGGVRSFPAALKRKSHDADGYLSEVRRRRRNSADRMRRAINRIGSARLGASAGVGAAALQWLRQQLRSIA